MKNIALERLRTGSCEASRAASIYRLRRSWGVVGPPSGSDSVKPAEALAPIMTMRDHGGLVEAAASDDLGENCESAAKLRFASNAPKTTERIRKRPPTLETDTVFRDFL